MTGDTTGRRRFLRIAGTTGAVGLGGCLRLTSDAQSTGTQTRDAARTTSTDSSDASNGLFASESEALEYVGSFAGERTTPVNVPTGEGSELIRFTGAGTSAGSGEEGGTYTSQDIMVESASESGVAFGGNANRALRVRNVTFDTAATFRPTSDAPALDVAEFDIDAEKEGVPPTSIDVTTADSAERRVLRGTWEGDRELFRKQAFSAYAVEILEGGTVIGRSGGSIRGMRYHWGAKQTRDSLYVTRQPSVSTDWNVRFRLHGDDNGTRAEADVEHLVDANAFRVDLAALDASSGRYGWSLRIGGNSRNLASTYLRLSSFRSELILL